MATALSALASPLAGTPRWTPVVAASSRGGAWHLGRDAASVLLLLVGDTIALLLSLAFLTGARDDGWVGLTIARALNRVLPDGVLPSEQVVCAVLLSLVLMNTYGAATRGKAGRAPTGRRKLRTGPPVLEQPVERLPGARPDRRDGPRLRDARGAHGRAPASHPGAAKRGRSRCGPCPGGAGWHPSMPRSQPGASSSRCGRGAAWWALSHRAGHPERQSWASSSRIDAHRSRKPLDSTWLSGTRGGPPGGSEAHQ